MFQRYNDIDLRIEKYVGLLGSDCFSCLIFRKNIKENPVVFEDTEEADTALSQLRPSSHSKSVVSY